MSAIESGNAPEAKLQAGTVQVGIDGERAPAVAGNLPAVPGASGSTIHTVRTYTQLTPITEDSVVGDMLYRVKVNLDFAAELEWYKENFLYWKIDKLVVHAQNISSLAKASGSATWGYRPDPHSPYAGTAEGVILQNQANLSTVEFINRQPSTFELKPEQLQLAGLPDWKFCIPGSDRRFSEYGELGLSIRAPAGPGDYAQYSLTTIITFIFQARSVNVPAEALFFKRYSGQMSATNDYTKMQGDFLVEFGIDEPDITEDYVGHVRFVNEVNFIRLILRYTDAQAVQHSLYTQANLSYHNSYKDLAISQTWHRVLIFVHNPGVPADATLDDIIIDSPDGLIQVTYDLIFSDDATPPEAVPAQVPQSPASRLRAHNRIKHLLNVHNRDSLSNSIFRSMQQTFFGRNHNK